MLNVLACRNACLLVVACTYAQHSACQLTRLAVAVNTLTQCAEHNDRSNNSCCQQLLQRPQDAYACLHVTCPLCFLSSPVKPATASNFSTYRPSNSYTTSRERSVTGVDKLSSLLCTVRRCLAASTGACMPTSVNRCRRARGFVKYLLCSMFLCAAQVPGSINSRLRAYQREGVRFLFKLYAQGMGGVLSDDMGLGKTLQVRPSKPARCKVFSVGEAVCPRYGWRAESQHGARGNTAGPALQPCKLQSGFGFKLYTQGMSGVLSDDMGLGKILQVRPSNPASCTFVVV